MSDIPVQDGQDVTLPVSSDLSAKQYYGTKLSSGVLTTTHTKANSIVGIIQEKIDGSSNAKDCRVRINGMSRAKAGDTISEMDELITDTDGTLIPTDGANQSVAAQALEAGVDGDIIAVIIKGTETTTS